MQKVKNNCKQIFILVVIIIVCARCAREKYFYKGLFSKEFCESIVEIQYVSYENEIYTIVDEEMIDEFRKVLYETRYRRLSGADGFDGGYSFRLFAEDREFDLVLTGNSLGWQGKHYEFKDKSVMMELLQKTWGHLGIEKNSGGLSTVQFTTIGTVLEKKANILVVRVHAKDETDIYKYKNALDYINENELELQIMDMAGSIKEVNIGEVILFGYFANDGDKRPLPINHVEVLK